MEEKKSSSGFLRGQLTFCSMLPMRSIPFKKLCLLGLNDTVFPKNDPHLPFDLLWDTRCPGDRSRRSDDRYQFLEAILSARGSLYLSYVGQSIRSNDSLPPSVLVSELLELVELYGVEGETLVDRHPLHGFSKSYFDKDSPLFSYDDTLLGVSKALAGGVVPAVPWWHGRLDVENRESVSVEELFLFFRNPQKYFVKQVLGISLDGYGSSVKEHEPFTLDSLQKYLVNQELVRSVLEGGQQDALLGRMQISGQWLLGRPGEVEFSAKQVEIPPFVSRVRELIASGQEESEYIDIKIGDLRVTGRLDSLYPNGPFLFRYARLKGKDLLQAWLHHCLATVCLGREADTRLLMKDGECVFPAEMVGEEDLQELLDVFLKAQQRPPLLMTEPAMAYAEQRNKTEKKGTGDPVAKAKKAVSEFLEKRYEPEWELLFSGQCADDFLGDTFIDRCEWFYQSIWKRAYDGEI